MQTATSSRRVRVERRIYVQPNGSAMRMLIADYEHGELDVVRVELNAARLQHWVHDPEGSAKRHDYGGNEKGVPD